MKVLILGGTGAIGTSLIDILLEKNSAADITVTSREAHISGNSRLKYIKGNARNVAFINELLSITKFDVIIDFMNYDLEEFRERINLLLDSTDHYVWFSSCRVYAESSERLTEKSPRLLEKSTDNSFLATNRYALRKARQEDLMYSTKKKNFTIIRPYITYNSERLQLGILEKEHWLYRLLNGKRLVLSNTMLDKETSLTNAQDVSEAIVDLIMKGSPKGEIFQIATSEITTWRNILNLYIEILRKELGINPIIYSSDNIKAVEMLWEGGYNTIYDRNYNRSFDSSKINKALGREIHYTPIKLGLSNCLMNFLKSNRKFLRIHPEYEAYQDLMCDEYSKIDYFNSQEDYKIYHQEFIKTLDKIDGLENIKTKIV